MRRDRAIWALVFAAMFAFAWVYASTLTASTAAQTTLLPPDVPVPAVPASPLRPLPPAHAPADPFAGGASAPAAAPPPVVAEPVPLPPPPVPEPPPEPAPEAAPAPSGIAPFKLTGIVTGAVRRAVLEAKETAYVVKEGDVIDGWTVVRIEARRVLLRGPSGEQVILELAEGTPPRGN